MRSLSTSFDEVGIPRSQSIGHFDDDEEKASLIDAVSSSLSSDAIAGGGGAGKGTAAGIVSRTGLMVLILLAFQNCTKNLLMRYVMKGSPKFLTSAAVMGSEFIKLSLSVAYILVVEGKSFQSIVQYIRDDYKNTMLVIIPASAYNLQMSLEYVALANLSAAVFSVLVQSKLLFTATFAAGILRKQLKFIQVVSLVLLTVGVMLCNLAEKKTTGAASADSGNSSVGIAATLGIALSSGFASVYTEKVIKAQRRPDKVKDYGLAYTQVQLALMSLISIGVYAVFRDWSAILAHGLFYNFTRAAFFSVVMSALGGLIVATVLKYADSVLKGYATAISVILTGVLDMMLFGTSFSVVYYLGIVNVIIAVFLYDGKDLDRVVCNK